MKIKQFIMANGQKKMEKDMEEESKFGQIKADMKATGKETKQMSEEN